MAILKDGFATLLAFAEDSDVEMEEKEVTPGGVSGGGEIDVSTMRNTAWRTKSPKSLLTLLEGGATIVYDPAFYDEIIAMTNTNQAITVTFPNSSTLIFWGWIDEFIPNALVEGEQPTAELTIIASNLNDSDVETAPAYSA